MHHRLLAVDVLAGVQRRDGDRRVPVVRGRDDDRVHVFAFQDLAEVARREGLGAPDLLAALAASVVNVGHRHEFHAGNVRRHLGVALAHAARPDQCDLDVVVG